MVFVCEAMMHSMTDTYGRRSDAYLFLLLVDVTRKLANLESRRLAVGHVILKSRGRLIICYHSLLLLSRNGHL